MDLLATFTLLAAQLLENRIFGWLEEAFYPALLLIFVVASLGVPIPEDLPLMAAGVILRTNPEIASWHLTILTAMVGIMSGDLILYTLGHRWGQDVFAHRSMRWLITPARLRMMTQRFHRHGIWMVFFGRFVVGIRAVMCLSAGVTRFPYWKFFLADFAGALLTVPLFIGLGYAFAYALPTLETYLGRIQLVVLLAVLVAIGAFVLYRIHRRSKLEIAAAEREALEALEAERRASGARAGAVPVGYEDVAPEASAEPPTPPADARGAAEPPTPAADAPATAEPPVADPQTPASDAQAPPASPTRPDRNAPADGDAPPGAEPPHNSAQPPRHNPNRPAAARSRS